MFFLCFVYKTHSQSRVYLLSTQKILVHAKCELFFFLYFLLYIVFKSQNRWNSDNYMGSNQRRKKRLITLHSIKVLNYNYILGYQKLNSIFSNVIICFILTLFLTLSSQPLLPSLFKLKKFTTPNESQMSVFCVW